MCHCLHDITLSSNDVSKANQSNMMFIFDVHFLHLIGNILVVIMVFCFMNRESVTNVFIANLSFGDILVIGFALPFRVSLCINLLIIALFKIIFQLLLARLVSLFIDLWIWRQGGGEHLALL